MSVPERCSVCRHSLAHLIDADLLEGRSVRSVAERYNLSKSTVQRHKTVCLAKKYAEAEKAGKLDAVTAINNRNKALAKTYEEEARRVFSGVQVATMFGQVVDDLQILRDKTMDAIEKGGKVTDAIAVLDKMLKAADTYSKLSAEARERERLDEEKLHKEWLEMKSIVLKWLDPYPDAKKGFLSDISKRRSAIFN